MEILFYFPENGASNSYFICREGSRGGILIDPGDFSEDFLSMIIDNGYIVASVILTHSHESHCNGYPLIKKMFYPRLYCYDPRLIDYQSYSLINQRKIVLNQLEFEIITHPDHSSDSILLKTAELLFTGDSDLLGNGWQPKMAEKFYLENSSAADIYNLPAHTMILPGHGAPSTIENERAAKNIVLSVSERIALPKQYSSEGNYHQQLKQTATS